MQGTIKLDRKARTLQLKVGQPCCLRRRFAGCVLAAVLRHSAMHLPRSMRNSQVRRMSPLPRWKYVASPTPAAGGGQRQGRRRRPGRRGRPRGCGGEGPQAGGKKERQKEKSAPRAWIEGGGWVLSSTLRDGYCPVGESPPVVPSCTAAARNLHSSSRWRIAHVARLLCSCRAASGRTPPWPSRWRWAARRTCPSAPWTSL